MEKRPNSHDLKLSGVIRTDKLSDILLFEADLNFANKLYFGMILMKTAEGLGVLLR